MPININYSRKIAKLLKVIGCDKKKNWLERKNIFFSRVENFFFSCFVVETFALKPQQLLSSAECVRWHRDGFCLEELKYFEVMCPWRARHWSAIERRLKTLRVAKQKLSGRPSSHLCPVLFPAVFFLSKKKVENTRRRRHKTESLDWWKNFFHCFIPPSDIFPALVRFYLFSTWTNFMKSAMAWNSQREEQKKKLEGNFLSLPCHKKQKKMKLPVKGLRRVGGARGKKVTEQLLASGSNWGTERK